MKSVGIISFHAAHNYGAVFQAYALQQTIINMDYKCEIINLRTPKQIEVYSILTKRKGFKYIIKNAYYLFHLKNRILKHKRFEEFISNNFTLSEQQYSSGYELTICPPEYDFYISGSDQIWNLELEDSTLSYFLPFIKHGKRIAYSPSFGPIGVLDVDKKQIVKNLLKDYDYLSIRENSGALLIEELIGEKVPVLVDPTMLLEKNEWDLISKPVDVPTDYIFFYALSAKPEMIKMIKQISKKLKLPVITPHVSNQYDITTNFIKVTDCGPCEFLSYLKNAKLVITSSFHGNVFSIIYKKPFFAINGLSDSRVKTLLNTMNLENRSISIDNLEEQINNAFIIDFSQTDAIIKKEKERALCFLKDAFGVTDEGNM